MKLLTKIKPLWAALLLAACGVGNEREAATPNTADALMDLGRAVRMGDVTAVDNAIAQGANLDVRLEFGATPLLWAIDSQDLSITSALLDAGADPNLADDDGATALMIACELGGEEITRRLVEANADVNETRADGISPLAICARHATSGAVSALLAAGANPTKGDADGRTPVMWAASGGKAESVRLLAEAGANINAVSTAGFTPLFFSIKSQDLETLKTVLALGGHTDHIGPKETTAVQLAVYQQNFSAVGLLMNHGADLAALDRHGNSLLHAASVAGDIDLAQRLIEAGADPNQLTGPSQITYVTEANFGVPPPEIPPLPPLFLAAENGEAEVMRILLEAGADTAFIDDDGRNVLHAAARGGSAETLALALSLAPDANTTINNGETPLHILLWFASGDPQDTEETKAMMRILADAGARIDLPNGRGRTVQDVASESLASVQVIFSEVFSPLTAIGSTLTDDNEAPRKG
ncbi:MAG: ankyrin repeat domain-containing protein [Pseudomonadota bacterium]